MTWQLSLIGRTADLEQVRRHALRGACVSLVGVSNIGKSALLRRLGDSTQTSSCSGTFVYVDCNQMPERTARALFVTVWQAVSARLPTAELRAGAQHLYDSIVHAPSAITTALDFEAAIVFALSHLPPPLVLCLDEFDEAYQHLEPQAFLNLRAFKDRYGDALAYVTATEREITRLPATREQGEFLELVAPHVHFMHFMEPEDTRAFCLHYAEQEGVTFSEADLAFIRDHADGHPGLVQAACCLLGDVTGAPTRDTPQDQVIHQLVQQNLTTDSNVRSECGKIWDDLGPGEREALQHLHGSGEEAQNALRSLRNKSIVRESKDGPVLFSRLFADFVRQQKIKQQPSASGISVDVDAERVWVDGKSIETLTDLEYRLLLFLYGRLDRVCDKYAIVEAVWGEEYIDDVDDARIEKLVSRVRQKIEPDGTHPRYLVSVRGRGYKLVR